MPVAGIHASTKIQLKIKGKVQILDGKNAGLLSSRQQVPLLGIFPPDLSASDALLFSLELRKAIKKYLIVEGPFCLPYHSLFLLAASKPDHKGRICQRGWAFLVRKPRACTDSSKDHLHPRLEDQALI